MTAGFFEALGVQPLLGRTFASDEDLENAESDSSHPLAAAVRGDRNIIGRSLTIEASRLKLWAAQEGFASIAVSCEFYEQSASTADQRLTRHSSLDASAD